jgi:ribonuclease HI
MEIKYNAHDANEYSEVNINTLNIYTDGSVIKINQQNRAGCGFAIYKNGTKIKEKAISLGTMTTINQCEMIAIREGAAEVENLLNNIYQASFHTDSITTIHKLKAITTSSKLNKLTHNNVTVSIYKVKAHIGITGNETADKLAERGAMTIKYRSEPFTYFTEKHITNKIMEKAMKYKINKINTAHLI